MKQPNYKIVEKITDGNDLLVVFMYDSTRHQCHYSLITEQIEWMTLKSEDMKIIMTEKIKENLKNYEKKYES